MGNWILRANRGGETVYPFADASLLIQLRSVIGDYRKGHICSISVLYLSVIHFSNQHYNPFPFFMHGIGIICSARSEMAH